MVGPEATFTEGTLDFKVATSHHKRNLQNHAEPAASWRHPFQMSYFCRCKASEPEGNVSHGSCERYLWLKGSIPMGVKEIFGRPIETIRIAHGRYLQDPQKAFHALYTLSCQWELQRESEVMGSGEIAAGGEQWIIERSTLPLCTFRSKSRWFHQSSLVTEYTNIFLNVKTIYSKNDHRTLITLWFKFTFHDWYWLFFHHFCLLE